ncbi:PepSY-associated TM helix domain-containing protein [Rariglobus hedericola]|uniref:PepSY domain-containing protein n=1 Tax=Rariglobus hedericola TaxID=2597822 RepID=A0A556QKI5_9BACT|nr:PepSY-associated TM helix domain-containing protein [Rariglobus hedericola]TSJ77148.1 PepSY domain-containing protein [Rariglobus hedericola]
MNLRKIFFWTHLVSGLTAGLVIALLALSGLTLSFEPQIIDFVERDVRRIPAAAADAEKTSIEELMKFIREEHPDARPAGFTVYADPTAAIVIPAGRGLTFYVDPHTTAIKEAGSAKLRAFFNFTLSLHRYLALSGDQRPIASQIIGIATFIFLGLSVTGLIIWWPRKWNWRSMKPSVWFIGAKGKLRDWNWHNVIGLWTTPLLILICITGLMMTYRWAGNLAYILTGNPVPAARAQGAPEGGPGENTPPATTPAPAANTTALAPAAPAPVTTPDGLPPVVVPTPPRGTRALAYDPLLAKVRETYPNWTQITLRPAGGNQRQQRRPAGDTPAAPAAKTEAPSETASAGERPARAAEGGGAARTPRAPQAVVLTVRTSDMWFSTSSLTLSLDPYTGDILRTQNFGDQNLGRRLRALAKPVHMGTIAGWPTQLIAAIASIGALFLVYTGFALSWRRFFGKNGRKKTKPAPTS